MLDFNNLPAQDKLYYLDAESGIAVYCADNRDVLPLLPEKSIDLVLTDPPYGVDKASWDSEFPSAPYWNNIMHIMNDDANLLVFTGLKDLPKKLQILSSELKYQWAIGWYKSNAMQFGKTGYSKNDLITWWRKTDGTVAKKFIDVIVSTMGLPLDKFDHPSPKPAKVINSLIIGFTCKANLILDPFLGSGTTAVAAKKLGRKCIGIEIEEKYCEIAVKRLSQSVMRLE